jgi:hypothetical protein
MMSALQHAEGRVGVRCGRFARNESLVVLMRVGAFLRALQFAGWETIPTHSTAH